MSVIYIFIDFILGKSWWLEKAKLIKYKLWSACRSAAGRFDWEIVLQISVTLSVCVIYHLFGRLI